MSVYEVDINGYMWWVSASDELQATDLIIDDLNCREICEEELDEAMDDMYIRELNNSEIQEIDVVDEYGEAMYSLWDVYSRHKDSSGVLFTNFCKDNEDNDILDPIDNSYDSGQWDSLDYTMKYSDLD